MGEAKSHHEVEVLNTKKTEPRKPWWLKMPTGLIVLAIFLIGSGYIYYYIQTLGMTNSCQDLKGPTFLQECLSTLKVNEIGDSLGGAFAPLAFIFLAGALIIQALELAAQRYEINETQTVMAAQVRVSEQQVLETKASTALLREQTNILKRQQAQRDAEIADHIYESAVTAFKQSLLELENINSIWGMRIILVNVNDKYWVLEFSKLADFPLPAPDNQCWAKQDFNYPVLGDLSKFEISDLCRELRSRIKNILSGSPIQDDKTINLPSFDTTRETTQLEAVRELLIRLKMAGANTSDAKGNEIEVTRFDETVHLLNSLLAWFEEGQKLRIEIRQKNFVI